MTFNKKVFSIPMDVFEFFSMLISPESLRIALAVD